MHGTGYLGTHAFTIHPFVLSFVHSFVHSFIPPHKAGPGTSAQPAQFSVGMVYSLTLLRFRPAPCRAPRSAV